MIRRRFPTVTDGISPERTMRRSALMLNTVLWSSSLIAAYPIYIAAKDLYLGTKHITINDLADNNLIGAKTFALLCYAMAIRKFGLGAIRYIDET